MFAREEQRGPLSSELRLQGRRVVLELCRELVVGRLGEQLDRRLEVRGARLQSLPKLDLGAEAVGLAEDLLGGPLVVPEPRCEGQLVELSDALTLGLEVKDAPTSTGSVRPGRGWRTRPPSSGPGDPGAGSAAIR